MSVSSSWLLPLFLAFGFVQIASAKDDREALRALIFAGDTKGAEQMIDGYFSAIAPGSQKFGDLRAMMQVFSVSDPRVDAFTTDWIRDYPDSPYAKAARGWYLFDMAFLYRGEDRASETRPEALAGFRQLLNESGELAEAAWNLEPRFVPASDLVLAVTSKIGGREDIEDVVAEVMNVSPNFGSIRRAVEFDSKVWGGYPPEALGYCNEYIAILNYDPELDFDTCELFLALSFDNTILSEPDVAEATEASEHPILQDFRMLLLLQQQTPPTGKQLKELKELLDPNSVTWVEMAGLYDRFIGGPDGLPSIVEATKIRRLKVLSDLVELDPYNYGLLDQRYFLAKEVYPDDLSRGPDPVLDTYGPALKAAPYNVRAWNKLRMLSVESQYPAVQNMDVEPFYVNTFIYRGYQPVDITDYAVNSFIAFRRMMKAPSASVEEVARREELACKTIRAIRVAMYTCEQSGDISPTCSAIPTVNPQGNELINMPMTDILRELEATLEPEKCREFRSAPVETILCDIQPFDVDVLRAKVFP
jgi:Domain of unknown function (DUF4034)